MKLYYKITSISSNADEIHVKSYGIDVFEFHKEDFENNWDNVIGNKYSLDPCLVADLSKLEMYGQEAHDVEYTLRDKETWFSYARNKVREDMLASSDRIADVDNERPVELYSNGTIRNSKRFAELLAKISSFNEVDLSHVTFANVWDETDSTTGDLKYDGSTFLSSSNIRKITKLPSLPENLYSFSPNTSYSLEKLNDISNLDFSNIIEYKSAFKNSKFIDTSNIDLTNVSKISSMFYSCPKLEILPNLNSLENLSELNILCSACSSLGNIGDINIPNGIVNTLFTGCSIQSIGNITIKQLNSNLLYNTTVNGNVGNIKILEETDSAIFANSSANNIGNIEINYGSNYPKLKINANTIGNITLSTTFNGSINQSSTSSIPRLTAEEAGVINITNKHFLEQIIKIPNAASGKYWLNTFIKIKKIKAINTYNLGQVPSSTGYEWWGDYVSTPTQYVKSITLPTGATKTIDITTPNSHYVNSMEFDFGTEIAINPEYPYECEILSTSTNNNLSPTNIPASATNGYTASSLTVNSLKISAVNDKFTIDMDLDGIQDGSTLTIKYTLPSSSVDFDATIDGWPFKGSSAFGINYQFVFELDEDISTEFEIELEDGETY